jgi:membrane fusion protein (multidrug efflux system)
MKKQKLLSILFILSVCLGGYSLMKSRSQSQQTASAEAIAVKTMTVKEQTVPIEVKAIGTLVASRRVEITPEISGHVKKVLFQDGQAVEAHAPLIQFDDAVYAVQYQSAKAKWKFSESDYKRKLYLAKQGAISEQAIDQAEAERKERKASVDEANMMLTKMRLNAPFAGMVSKSKVSEGDYVTTGTGIVTLTDLKQLRIEYDVPEQYLPQIKLGLSVDVTTPTYPGQKFKATLTYVSPTVNIQNRSISLYATLNNVDQRLKPGMFVNLSQHLGTNDHVILVPSRSLVPTLDGEQIYKVINEKAIPTVVTIGGHLNDDQVQILSGLSAGDRIVTDGQLKLRQGIAVKIDS